MQPITPIAPPAPIPSSFRVPDVIFIAPTPPDFEWEPVPIFVEDIPEELESPEPKPKVEEDKGSSKSKSKDKKGAPDANPSADLVPEMAEVQTWEVPIVGVEIPVPRTEILVTATTTAGVSSVVAVGGTLFATTLFRQLQPILKPIFKFIFKKLAAVRKKPPPLSWSRQRLLDRQLASVKKQ